jgi:hypothetical protein
MPIVKPRTRRVKRIRHICRLLEPTRTVLLEYARFISDSPDYVLNALIDATLAKDRDFLAWRAEQTPLVGRETSGSVVPARPRTGTSPE